MKEICLPYSGIANNEMVEVMVKNCNSEREWHYRVESVYVAEKDQGINNKQTIIDTLISYIKNHDSNWELINIYDSEPKEGFIHILYRKRN